VIELGFYLLAVAVTGLVGAVIALTLKVKELTTTVNAVRDFLIDEPTVIKVPPSAWYQPLADAFQERKAS
jgi:hypothetical protein